ncbi:MAG: hypothetical protein E7172_00705 [Firmicutes bacterium]|nr:hypothetical protein [Bacillota bacterium]
MKKDIDVLNNIYKIVDMGIIGIDNVIMKIKDKCLEKIFIDQKKEYNSIKILALRLLNEYDETAKGIGKMAEISSSAMTNMELMKDDSDNNITKMMIEGSNKGIIELQSILNQKNIKNEQIINLAEELLKILEHNIQDLKKYL